MITCSEECVGETGAQLTARMLSTARKLAIQVQEIPRAANILIPVLEATQLQRISF